MYKFEYLPKQVSESFYDVARKQIVNFYRDIDDVVAIYEYGSVSSPGVSDLDIILVLSDEIKSSEDTFDFRNISREVHGLVADGNVIKMSQSDFQRIHFLDNNLTVKRLSGKTCPVSRPNDSDQKILELISIVDWLPERILRLNRVLEERTINVTMALCLLHSLSYSIRKIDVLTSRYKKSNNSTELLDSIKLLRNCWYECKSPHILLIDCINNAIRLGFEYIAIFSQYLSGRDDYASGPYDINEDVQLELYHNNFLRFVGATEPLSLRHESEARSRKENRVLCVPNLLVPHFFFLATRPGLLSQVMRRKMSPEIIRSTAGLSETYKRVLGEKLGVAEANAQFLMKNKFKQGLLRYGFHFVY